MASATVKQIVKKIRTDDQDGGLQSCLKEAQVERDFRDAVKDKSSRAYCPSLTKFALSFSKDPPTQDKEIDAFLHDAGITPSRAYRADLRLAVQVAHNFMEGTGPSAEAAEELDAPIDPSTSQDIDDRWVRSYGTSMTIHTDIDPDDKLLGRLHREIQRKTFSLLRLDKIKTKAFAIGAQPQPSREKVGENNQVGLFLEVKDTREDLKLNQCYWSLRTLAVAWAKTGNFMVPSRVDREVQEVRYAPYDKNIDYADFAYRQALSVQGNYLGRPLAACQGRGDEEAHDSSPQTRLFPGRVPGQGLGGDEAGLVGHQPVEGPHGGYERSFPHSAALVQGQADASSPG